MKPNPKMTATHVLARVALLVAAWGVVWAVTPQALLSSPGASFEGASPLLVSQFALVFLAGLFCGAGRWLTGSVWGSVFLHVVNNLASLGVFHR